MDNSNDIDSTVHMNKYSNQEESLIDKEKNILKKQIEELQRIISDIELDLEIKKYGEHEIVNKSSTIENDIQSLSSQPHDNNIDDILEYEFFKMSGTYCSKVTDDEYIFNFSPSSNFKSPYAVQIFIKENEVELGIWVMPWGITVENIISETPLEQPEDIVTFLRNCKRHIDCHAERKEQYEKLKEVISSIKNVEVDTTLGFTSVFCLLHNVYDNSTSKKFNLTVNIYYGSGRVRPSAINIEWSLKDRLPSDTINKMKTFTKYFKTENLSDAFKNIMEQAHPIYIWKAEKFTDNILDDIQIQYSSENNSNAEMSDDEYKHTPKRNKKRNIHQLGVKSSLHRKRNPKNLNLSRNSDNHDENNELELSHNSPESKPQSKKYEKKKLPNPIKSKSKINNMKNIKSKSRQSQLSFKSNQISIDKKINMTPIHKFKMRNALTSTPMTLHKTAGKYQSTLNSLMISPIVEKSTATENIKIQIKKK